MSAPLASTRASARSGAGLCQKTEKATAPPASKRPLAIAIVAEDCEGGGGGGALDRRRSPWRGETAGEYATPTVWPAAGGSTPTVLPNEPPP
jgi:hypothetical protein